MGAMRATGVVRIPVARERERMVARAVAVRRRIERRAGGRVWINGRELGGPDPRYAHLAASYD